MKDIIKTIKSSKRILYISLLSLIVVFCIVLNYTFSAFTQSTTRSAANLTVRELSYTTSVNGNNTDIISAPAGETTKSNIVIVSENVYDTKYEITYQVCSDSACNNIISKPNDFEVYYSSVSQDPINGTVQALGQKTIRIVIINDTETNYYIKIGINSGYAHNALTLTGQINEPYYENDLIVKVIVNNNEQNNFPTTSKYDVVTYCNQLDGKAVKATGRVMWDSSQWVLTVYGLTKNRTLCTVTFKTGTGPNAWYNSEEGDLLYGIKKQYANPVPTYSKPTWSKLLTRLAVGSVATGRYITYGTGYTQDSSTGKYSLTGVSTCLYSSCYSSLKGKYVVSGTVANNFSTSSSALASSNLSQLVQVYEANSNSLIIERLFSIMDVDSTHQNYYFTYADNYEAYNNYMLYTYIINVQTLKYSDEKELLIGKYLPYVNVDDVSRETNTPVADHSRVYSPPQTVISVADNYIVMQSPTNDSLSSTADDYGNSFYIRGPSEKNFVSFAGMCWRIVRVVGDGSIKLVLYNQNTGHASNPCDSSLDSATAAVVSNGRFSYTTTVDKNPYIGFMYSNNVNSNDYDTAHANNNDSQALRSLKTWYDSVFTSADKNKLADVIWCNDKRVISDTTYNPLSLSNIVGTGIGSDTTYYKVMQDLNVVYSSSYSASHANPTLKCGTSKSDNKISKFTASTSTDNGYGNGLLNGYKIGLLTAQEVAFTGSQFNTTDYMIEGYLYKNAKVDYWTMSPALFDGRAAMFAVNSKGSIVTYYANADYYLRPAIALKSDTTISGGTGTQADPFVVN